MIQQAEDPRIRFKVAPNGVPRVTLRGEGMTTCQEEAVMFQEEESGILQKDRANSTYELLLRRAVEEGRIGGPGRCRVCGMRYRSAPEAEACCEKVLQHNRI